FLTNIFRNKLLRSDLLVDGQIYQVPTDEYIAQMPTSFFPRTGRTRGHFRNVWRCNSKKTFLSSVVFPLDIFPTYSVCPPVLPTPLLPTYFAIQSFIRPIRLDPGSGPVTCVCAPMTPCIHLHICI
ncbi:hypothetical protein STEG23_013601, partial [Scotinomys teguina]